MPLRGRGRSQRGSGSPEPPACPFYHHEGGKALKDKMKTVAFSNLIASLVFLGAGAWAYSQTLSFRTVKGSYVQAATFPQIMLLGMMGFAVILLIQSLWNLAHLKAGSWAAEKAASLNFVKDRGVLFALVTMVLCAAFVAWFRTLGYVLASFLLCFAVMVLIGKRNLVQMLLISALVPLCMWLLFYLLLKVNIPMGPLTFVRDFVDDIL